MPPASKNELQEMLPFEAEKYIPFSLAETVLDFYPVKELSPNLPNEVLLLAVKKQTVETIGNIFISSGLFPENITSSTFVLEKLCGQFVLEEPVLLFHIESDCWESVLLNKGRVILSRGLNFSKSMVKGSQEWLEEIHHFIALVKKEYPQINIGQYFIFGENSQTNFAMLSKTLAMQGEILTWRRCFDCDYSNPDFLPLFEGRYVELGLLSRDVPAIQLMDPAQKKAVQDLRRKKKLWFYGKGLGGMLLLLGAWIGYSQFHAWQSHSQAEKKIISSKKEIASLEMKQMQLKAIKDFKANRFVPLNILNELCRLLPHNAYLTQMRYDEENFSLLIKGRTDSYKTSSDFMSRLVQSKCFKNVINKGAHSVKLDELNLIDFEVECVVAK